MLKRVMIGLMVMSMALMLVADTNAAVCVARVGGKCVLWTGSLVCTVAGIGLGNCDGVYLGCEIEGSGRWAVVCGAPGNTNPAPGINLVYFEGDVSGSLELTSDDCDTKGTAIVEVEANITDDIKTALKAKGVCPNPNWYVIDAVPEKAWLRDVQWEVIGDQICAVADAVFDCTLPYIETLEWNSDTEHFEERQYNCTLEEYNKYPKPTDCRTYVP